MEKIRFRSNAMPVFYAARLVYVFWFVAEGVICDTGTMLLWILISIGSAVAASWAQTAQKWSVTLTQYSKFTIACIASLVSAATLLAASYVIRGVPIIDERYWLAMLVTGLINAATFPMMLKAYEVGEFSSVFSMSLLTPIFLLFTSFVMLGEVPSWSGAIGVVLSVLGLWVITSKHEHRAVPNFALGNWLAILVALLWSVSVNFDKLAATYSNPFFSPVGVFLVMAVAHGAYLLARHRRLIVKSETTEGETLSPPIQLPAVLVLVATGVTFAVSSALHNSALLLGFASYTIAIKRLSVLLGVLWGWLFFHEKNIGRKLFGALIAIAGVAAIVLW